MLDTIRNELVNAEQLKEKSEKWPSDMHELIDKLLKIQKIYRDLAIKMGELVEESDEAVTELLGADWHLLRWALVKALPELLIIHIRHNRDGLVV